MHRISQKFRIFIKFFSALDFPLESALPTLFQHRHIYVMRRYGACCIAQYELRNPIDLQSYASYNKSPSIYQTTPANPCVLPYIEFLNTYNRLLISRIFLCMHAKYYASSRNHIICKSYSVNI